MGKVNSKQLQDHSFDETVIVPQSISIICLERLSQSPVPRMLFFVYSVLCDSLNFSKICSICFGEMPTPVSHTRIWRYPFLADTSILIFPQGRVNLQAFERRLVIISRNFSSSVEIICVDDMSVKKSHIFFSSYIASKSLTHCFIIFWISTRHINISIRPASILEISRILFTIFIRESVLSYIFFI